MHDPALLALYDALTDDERAALDAAVAEQPALAEAAARWRSLRAAVRADLGRSLPDRALLVLHALADGPDALSDDEAAALAQAQPALDAALARHPGLVAAVRRIRADRDAFEAAWAEHVVATPAEAPLAPRTRPVAPAPDRPALRRLRPARWAARIAAVVAVAAFGTLATVLLLRDAGWETLADAQTVTLADGSTIELADGARLMVPDDGTRAARLLGGDALFRIAHDPADPFTVTTPNAEIAVLGTTFSVQSTDIETVVTLVEGAVALAPRAQPDLAVTLAPGQASTVLALDAPSDPAPADLGQIAVGRSVFAGEGTPAGVIVGRLAARFATAVAIDSVLAAEPMSAGEYGADGLKDALDKLALALGADVLGDAAGYRIAR